MKMYHFRVIASFVLAIFLMCTSVLLIAWACDSYKRAVEDRERDVKDAKRKIEAIKEEGLLGTMTDSAWKGAVALGATGIMGGWKVGVSTAPLTKGISVPTAVLGGLVLGGTTGYVGGSIHGAFAYYDDLSDAKDDLAYYETELAKAKQALEDCLNPPARYTYTCPYCNTLYEFSEDTYGSASDTYTAYMNFINVHVHNW